jgi:hypothetical protein
MTHLPVTTTTAKELLDAYDTDRFNVLQPPTLTVQQDDYELVLSVVRVDPADRELCYPTPGKSGHVSLHAYTLGAIAAAAGLSIGASKIERSADGNSTTATCSGTLQDGPGSRRVISASYTVDVPARIEELRLAAQKKPADKCAEALAKLPAEEARLRRFATALADSGAQARVVRKALHIRSAYTIEEARRPFIIARIHFKPQDPRLRFAQEIMHQWSRESLFGPQQDTPAITNREAQLARALLESADVDPVQDPPQPQTQPEEPQSYDEAIQQILEDDSEE